MRKTFKPFALAAPDTDLKKLVLINDTRADFHHGCEIAVSAIQSLAQANGMDFIATAPARSDYAQNGKFMSAFAAADAVVVNGEGSIHHNSPTSKLLLQAGKLAKQQGKPALLFNTTWDKNGPEFAAHAAEFDLISLRESASHQALEEFGLKTHIAPDAALYFDWTNQPRRQGITVTDSVLTEPTRLLTRFAHKHKAQLINIRFTPSTLAERGWDFRRMIDRAAPFNIANMMDAIKASQHGFGTKDAATPDFVNRIARSKLLITGRFHAVILALATQTPFLAVASNTHKIQATLRDAGLQPWRMIAPSDLSDDLLEKASRWHGEELENLRAFVQKGRAAQAQVFAALRARLK